MVAYAVVMGAVMASGKEVMGRIPKGKVNVTPVFLKGISTNQSKQWVLFKWWIGWIASFQLVDFEAMTTPSPDGFSKTAKSWMNLKR